MDPREISFFMTSFCRAQMFEEQKLLETLEAHFLRKIEETDGTTLTTIFAAHSNWNRYMLDECLIKKSKSSKVFDDFRVFSLFFYEKCVEKLLQHVDEINLKGVCLVLVQGHIIHLKRKHLIRLMFDFALRGVHALERERSSVGSTFDRACINYFYIAKFFCLNQ